MLSTEQQRALETMFEAEVAHLARRGASLEYLADARLMVESLLSGAVTMQDLTGITDEALDTVYRHALRHYEHGSMEKARDILEKVLMINPYHQAAWRALGAVHQELNQPEDALGSYDYALALDPNDVVSSIFRAEVLLQMERVEEALPELEKAIGRAKGDAHLAHWVSRAEVMLEAHLQPVD